MPVYAKAQSVLRQAAILVTAVAAQANPIAAQTPSAQPDAQTQALTPDEIKVTQFGDAHAACYVKALGYQGTVTKIVSKPNYVGKFYVGRTHDISVTASNGGIVVEAISVIERGMNGTALGVLLLKHERIKGGFRNTTGGKIIQNHQLVDSPNASSGTFVVLGEEEKASVKKVKNPLEKAEINARFLAAQRCDYFRPPSMIASITVPVLR